MIRTFNCTLLTNFKYTNFNILYWRPRFNPWDGKISWRKKWQPTPIFLPRKSHGLRNLVGYSPWGRKESDTTERLHFHFHYIVNCGHYAMDFISRTYLFIIGSFLLWTHFTHFTDPHNAYLPTLTTISLFHVCLFVFLRFNI